MITMQEWNAMNGKEQTLWLEMNKPASKLSSSQRKLVHGVGVNYAHYCVQPAIDGKQVICPSYSVWTAMLERAYSDKFHARRQTYIRIEICDEWKNFCAFRDWWIENQVDGWQLDKDLLSDTGVYSPETCIFVPAWLNSFTINSAARRGNHPIGASKHKATGKYQSACGNVLTGKVEYLGLFNTPGEAHLAWRTRKLEIAAELRPRMDEIDLRIYPRVVEIINNAK